MYFDLRAVAELAMSQNSDEDRKKTRMTMEILGLSNATSLVEVTGPGRRGLRL